MERTIRVTGKGTISVKPDQIRILITQHSIEKTYEKAIKESADKKDDLTGALEKLGFEKSALKTLYFNINTEYESYQAKDKSWKDRLIGYSYTHRMKLEFPADNDTLGKVLFALAHCPGEPQFSIEYTISDKESAKNELLVKSVEDSKAKAEVLCKSAGVKLLSIQTIDYSWNEIDFVSRPVSNLMLKSSCIGEMPMADGIGLNIEADDIDITDTVTVVWGIE